MLIRNCILAGALIWTTAVFAQICRHSPLTRILPTHKDRKIGTATISQADGGIRIDVQIFATAARHAWHLHSYRWQAG